MQNAKEGMRITWIGLWVNLLLGAVKTLVGWLLGSKALIADGMHSLSTNSFKQNRVYKFVRGNSPTGKVWVITGIYCTVYK